MNSRFHSKAHMYTHTYSDIYCVVCSEFNYVPIMKKLKAII